MALPEYTNGYTGLTEFTVEIETRPMVSLDPDDLDALQEAAADEQEMHDPVFALDESKGSILAVFQVVAVTAALAASLGCWVFFNTMIKAGIVKSADAIESISVNKLSPKKTSFGLAGISVTLPDEENAPNLTD